MMTDIHAKPLRAVSGNGGATSVDSRKRVVEKGESGGAVVTIDKKKKEKKKALKRL